MNGSFRRFLAGFLLLLTLLQRDCFVVSLLLSLPVNIRHPRQCDQASSALPQLSALSSSSSSSSSPWINCKRIHDIQDLKEGDLVLSRVESNLGCHDLRQPYLHKAVVLILDHDPEDFTQGVLLNRASDLILNHQDIIYEEDEDDKHPETFLLSNSSMLSSWKIHFGGDIGSWYEEQPNFVCLHTIGSDAALAVSDSLICDSRKSSGIFVTSHLGARSLVESGEASADDFFTFSGFCGWEEGQLQTEVDRGSWYLASLEHCEGGNNDVQLDHPASLLWQLMEEYSWKNSKFNVESAAIEFWRDLVTAIGMGCEIGDPNSFSDLMLKEWATQRLLVAKGELDEEGQPAVEINDSDIHRAVKTASMAASIVPGTLLRGSSMADCPFLLKDQLFHKATILLLQEDPDASVGVILNLPTTETYLLELGTGSNAEIPIRYGGPSGREDKDMPLFWFHNDEMLKRKGVGRPLTCPSRNADVETADCVFVCTEAEVTHAIQANSLVKDRFFLVRGFSAWEKKSGSYGILGEAQRVNFEVVPESRYSAVLDQLLAQTQLSEEAWDENVQILQNAWAHGGIDEEKMHVNRYVFGSGMELMTLADTALANWIKIFILAKAENYDYMK
ncbi:ACR COG1678 domain containing protein [Nitzschia inconspicua]|uniref:ACR COG1678 domain containing protein n=1 Tax=Nitzschia inconspicua TaxID=303405 RepID=A0A9K3M633_9STRA|nr:ACR COG1678 domain containing protein [Nitzschia inconspicua]